MLYGEIKDVIREHLSRTVFPTAILDFSLQHGRRLIEQQGNWYWMRNDVYFMTVPGRRVYPIWSANAPSQLISITDFPPSIFPVTGNPVGQGPITSVAGPTGAVFTPTTFSVDPILVPNFKAVKFMAVKPLKDVEWSPMDFGGVSKEEADLHYSITETGMPEFAALDNMNVFLYPTPNDVYYIKLWYWQWTQAPSSNLLTDELGNRFPESLIYGSLIWAHEIELKDFQGAQYWRTLLGGPPNNAGEIGIGGEIAKIRRYNFLREQQNKISFIPLTGPFQRVRRLRITQNIWLGSGGSL